MHTGISPNIHAGHELVVQKFMMIDPANADSIEPGTRVRMRFVVANIGLVATPPNEAVSISIGSSRWVTPESEPLIAEGVMQPLDSITGEADFDVPSVHELATLNLAEKATVRLEVGMSSRGQGVHRVAMAMLPFTVRFPVGIAAIRFAPRAFWNEAAPFKVDLTNPCNVVLAGRQVSLELTVEGAPIELSTGTRNTSAPFSNPLVINTPAPAPRVLTQLLGQYKASERPDVLPVKAQVVARLWLERQDREGAHPVLIQECRSEIELIDHYQPLPNADALVVINERTTHDEIAAWDEVALRTGLTFDYWNTSLYHGISLEKELACGKSLRAVSGGKLLIFSFPPANGESTFFPSAEIYRAVDRGQSAVCVIGRIPSLPLYPPVSSDVKHRHHAESFMMEISMIETEATKRLNTLPLTCVGSFNSLGMRKAKKLHRKLTALHPHQRLSVTYDLDEDTLRVRTALSTHLPMLAWNRYGGEISTADFIRSDSTVMSVVKLLPIRRKCNMYGMLPAKMVNELILSDLAQEILSLGSSDWATEKYSGVIQGELPVLRTLISVTKENTEHSGETADVLVRLRELLLYSRRPKTDAMLRISQAAAELIAPLKLPNQDPRPERRDLTEVLSEWAENPLWSYERISVMSEEMFTALRTPEPACTVRESLN